MDQENNLFRQGLRRVHKNSNEPRKAYDSVQESRIDQLQRENKDLKQLVDKQQAEYDNLNKKYEEEKQKNSKITFEREKTLSEIVHDKKDLVEASLKNELESFRDKNHRLQISVTTLEREVDSLRTSLSKVAGSMLTESNPFITDLSDPHRPEKLAEKFSKVYDNDWTDAYETFEEEDDKKICEKLMSILKDCWTFCLKKSENQLEELRKAFLLLGNTENNGKKQNAVTDNTPVQSNRLIKDTRKLFAQRLIPQLCQHYWDTKSSDLNEPLRLFTDACIDLCWYSAVSDPPLHFAFEVDNADDFRAYTKSGETLDFVVWPAMYLTEHGPLMYKGVAQYKSEDPKSETMPES